MSTATSVRSYITLWPLLPLFVPISPLPAYVSSSATPPRGLLHAAAGSSAKADLPQSQHLLGLALDCRPACLLSETPSLEKSPPDPPCCYRSTVLQIHNELKCYKHHHFQAAGFSVRLISWQYTTDASSTNFLLVTKLANSDDHVLPVYKSVCGMPAD